MVEDDFSQQRSIMRVPIRFAIEELKFLKSVQDIRNFYNKLKLVVPRVIGTYETFYKAPPILQIEPTNVCNADCICCPVPRSSREKGHMDFSLFKQIIDEAAIIGVNSIFLFLHGEPMIHPKIVDMLRYIKRCGLSFHLTTNGITFSEKAISGILRAGVDNGDHISFSIQGASPEVHDKIVGRNCYEKVLKNIHSLLRHREELKVNGPVIETVYYIMPENQHETQKYLKLWRGVVDHVRLSGEISQSFAQHGEEPEIPIIRTTACSNLWQKMTILWNGEVILCCNDVDGKIVLGNLNDQSIEEIWNSEKLLAIKRIHKKKEFERIPLCHTCDM
jgi:radical SAM protein with 4Fe4S-binding SPASM domain